MGLDIRVKNRKKEGLPYGATASRSYSGFSDWRQEVCDFLGLGDLHSFEWFGGDKKRPSKRKEPLVHILKHSDCQGYIRNGLTRIKPRLEEFYRRQSSDSYNKEQTRKLIESLERCIQNKGRLCFY